MTLEGSTRKVTEIFHSLHNQTPTTASLAGDGGALLFFKNYGDFYGADVSKIKSKFR